MVNRGIIHGYCTPHNTKKSGNTFKIGKTKAVVPLETILFKYKLKIRKFY